MEHDIIPYILDSCALIAYLRKEKGYEKLKTLFKDKKNIFFMHAVNLGEIYYFVLKKSDKEKADNIILDVEKLPIQFVWGLDIEFIKSAGEYKAAYKVSYADCFVLALGKIKNASIITTDHHEFDHIEEVTALNFYWLR